MGTNENWLSKAQKLLDAYDRGYQDGSLSVAREFLEEIKQNKNLEVRVFTDKKRYIIEESVLDELAKKFGVEI